MPKYSIYVNKDQDKILMEYGKLLVKEGFIKEPINPYKICKFIFNKLTKTLKEKNMLNTSKIIDNKTPVEQEISNPEETDLHKIYKQLR